jgi:hypothetical protein
LEFILSDRANLACRLAEVVGSASSAAAATTATAATTTATTRRATATAATRRATATAATTTATAATAATRRATATATAATRRATAAPAARRAAAATRRAAPATCRATTCIPAATGIPATAVVTRRRGNAVGNDRIAEDGSQRGCDGIGRGIGERHIVDGKFHVASRGVDFTNQVLDLAQKGFGRTDYDRVGTGLHGQGKLLLQGLLVVLLSAAKLQ